MIEKKIYKDLSNADSRELAEAIVGFISERKTLDITLLHVENQTVLTDYFVICSCTSTTQLKSLVSEIEFKLNESNDKVWNIDGHGSDWTAIDIGSVIVHVFLTGTRNFYKIEKLWSGSEEIDLSTIINNQ